MKAALKTLAKTCALSPAIAFLCLAPGCKKKPQQETRSERLASDLAAITSPGFDLYDSNPLSSKLVLVKSAGQTVAAGVLVTDNSILAPGIGCDQQTLSLVFATQGNGAVTGRSALGGETRQVANCTSVRQLLEEKAKATQPTSTLLTTLSETLANHKDFEISQLSFDGGLPSSRSIKWSPTASHDEAITTASNESEWRSWESLTGKFIAYAGFNRRESAASQEIFRRTWLPLRIPTLGRTEDPFVFNAETWIVDSQRSPIKSTAEWLKGPSTSMLPGMVFSGVARYPNIAPDAEIHAPAPKLLCFILQWDEIKEAPEGMRFSPRCLDAAPVFALLR